MEKEKLIQFTTLLIVRRLRSTGLEKEFYHNNNKDAYYEEDDE